MVSNDIRNLARDASGNMERAKEAVRAVLDQVGTLKRDLQQVTATAELEAQSNQATLRRLAATRAGRHGIGLDQQVPSGRGRAHPCCDHRDGGSGRASRRSGRGGRAGIARGCDGSEPTQSRGAEDLAAAIE